MQLVKSIPGDGIEELGFMKEIVEVDMFSDYI